MEALLTALITFAVTNIDDLFLLMLFFSESNPSFRRRHIVIGQYLGFAVLVVISLIGFFGSFVIPQAWIGVFGLAPIVIGIRKLVQPQAEAANTTGPPAPSPPPSWLESFLHPKTYSVAVVTFANGGDNIGVYTPLFASSDLSGLAIILGVFFALVAVWCFTAHQLTRQPAIAGILEKYGHILVPFVLIGLGIYIILENGTLKLIGL